LAAAIALAQARCSVLVLEAAETAGGGLRSAELTLPGFTHDVCSAIHPFAVLSPLFRTLPLASYGLDWVEPRAMLAHPFDDGTAAIVHQSIERTAESLGDDGEVYQRVFGTMLRDWQSVEPFVLGSPLILRHPIALARFGMNALRSATAFARATFRQARTRALFGGLAAHGMLPLERRITAGFGIVLGTTLHAAGWLFPRGGAQRFADALAAYLRSLGGEIVTGRPVTSIDNLPPARAVLCDLSPRPFLRIAGAGLPAGYRRGLERYRYGMGAFKIDYALEGPIPWRAPACAQAATVHLGGTLEEIARSEADAWQGRANGAPFVLLVQPTLFDSTRAPAGRHIAWTYCHVPHASAADMLPAIERQIERFAPGFRDRVLARSIMTPADIERRNPNFAGGDIASGVADLRQLFLRPSWRRHGTPVRGLYLCSAATPPGVGVHGMCGALAAARALREVFGNK
jgi:phytoene dehydrogenase-like protein